MRKSDLQPPAPITADDLRAYITSQDDFAFEREVYHKAHGLGLSADHAGLYVDPVTNKRRQFDLRASHTRVDRRICLTIECKGLSASYPLLVSCVPRPQAESFHEVLYYTNTDDPMGSRVAYVRGSRLYKAGEPVGKAMRQVRRDNKGELIGGDDVFDKWMQALASAADMITEAAEQLSAPRPGKPRFAAVLPVLVVSDDTLWVADYASNGRLQRDPFTVTEVTYYLGREYQLPCGFRTYTVSHLHICTRSQVGLLLQEVAGDGGIWAELFESVANSDSPASQPPA
jgi:hypothetical protein